MTRLPRGIYGNGFFHVMVQGINKEYIFEETKHKKEYLNLMMSNRNKFNIMLLAYCIMDNHAHLLIYVDDVYELSAYMRLINCKFAKAYNSDKKRVGYVFRDRFNSQHISDNDYLFTCLNYIHMNPVEANMVPKPTDYEYSSYNDYLNKTNLVTDEVINKIFGKTKNYLEVFLSISNKEVEIMDIDRENKNFEIAVQIFLETKNTNLIQIKNNEKELVGFCNEIVIKKKYKQRQVAKLLGIPEVKLSKILNKMERKKSV